jgi:flagellar basal-body rod protein FlgF
MIRGFYTATAGMASEMTAINLLANNVANANTEGFKEDFETVFRQAANPLSYGMGGLVRGTGVLSVQSGADLTQGALTQSRNPLDLALQGPGFFAVQSSRGTVYTRNGQFLLSATGQLTTEGGNLVLDVNGRPITVPDPQGKAILVNQDGTLIVGGTTIAKIGVFNAAAWQKTGNDLYLPTTPATPVTGTIVRQSMIEGSNVDLVSEMGTIMSVERSYEASSQFQQAQDQILQLSVNDIGKLP